MNNRVRQHKLKMAHLDYLFDRELSTMRRYSIQRLKSKKYKQLAYQLSQIHL